MSQHLQRLTPTELVTFHKKGCRCDTLQRFPLPPQIYPKLFLSGSTSMFDSEWWQVLVRCWETVVYNPLVDLQHTWQLLLLFLALVVACWRVWKLCWNYRCHLPSSHSSLYPLEVCGLLEGSAVYEQLYTYMSVSRRGWGGGGVI